jgi:hypothetical protein
MKQWALDQLAERVTGVVGRLVPGDRGVEFFDEIRGERPASLDRVYQKFKRLELGVDDGQGVLGDSALAGGRLASNAFRNKRLGDSPAHIVKAFDDTSFDRVTTQCPPPRLLELGRRHEPEMLLPGATDRIHGRQQVLRVAVHCRQRRNLPPPNNPLTHGTRLPPNNAATAEAVSVPTSRYRYKPPSHSAVLCTAASACTVQPVCAESAVVTLGYLIVDRVERLRVVAGFGGVPWVTAGRPDGSLHDRRK